MTVNWTDGDGVYVSWFDKAGNRKNETFEPAILKKLKINKFSPQSPTINQNSAIPILPGVFMK